MSRYPFRDYADELLRSRSGVYSEATFTRERRRLDRMFRDILRMFEAGEISTTSPAKLSDEDIRRYLVWRRSLNYSRAEYSHEIFTLRSICEFAGNLAVDRVMRMYPTLKPVSKHRRLPVLSDDQISSSMDAAKCLVSSSSDDLRSVRAAALFVIALRCGLRTKELQFLDIDSVDEESHRLNLIHVKGENTYGNGRTVFVDPDAWEVFSAYLGARSRLRPSVAVFVTSKGVRLSSNAMRVDLERISGVTGIHYDFRILRRTYGQQLINAGLPVEVVSVLLGHSTTRTTEQYYCRLSNEEALSQVERLYKKNEKISEKVVLDGAGGSQHTSDSQLSSGSACFDIFFADSPTYLGALARC